MAELQIEYGRQMSILVMELTAIPKDRRFPTPAERGIAMQPAEAEFEMRVGMC